MLLGPSFDVHRRNLFAEIVESVRPFAQITYLSNDALMQLLLYGDQYLPYDLTRRIFKLASGFIYEAGQFDKDVPSYFISKKKLMHSFEIHDARRANQIRKHWR